jgi:putative transposase
VKIAQYSVIERFSQKYSVISMCEMFHISRTGYYNWLKNDRSKDKDLMIGNLIKKCQNATKFTYGYRRVKLWLLRESSLVVNHKAILRLMNKYGLLSEVRRRRGYYQYGEHLFKYENKLSRDFEADKPNQKWVTDISYIFTKEGILYLSMIKDLYDNFIIAYETGTEQKNQLVYQTVKKAKKEVADGLILHSDQGFQYASTGYFNLTQEYSIVPSMSRAGNPLDNACAENFFGTLKSECIYRVKPKTLEEARQLIDDYIYFYNYERIQLRTKLTPYEKRRMTV